MSDIGVTLPIASLRTRRRTPPLPVALKALVAHHGTLGAGIVADIVLRPPVEVDIDDAAIGFMRSSALQGSRKTTNIQASSRVIWESRLI